jgi:cyclopropane fatty-acyl-phospholipid synthase-like methyltransferase
MDECRSTTTEVDGMSILNSKTSNKMYDWRIRSIYQALNKMGKEQGSLEVSDLVQLGHLDQYHYLGTSACDEGIDILGLTENAHVLDIGSGVGGPARYISHKTGCQVTGVELQNALNEMAIELTQRVGLSNKVKFITGNILDVTIEDNYFDHFVSWLVFLHIPYKDKLFSSCFNALKSGGTFLIEDMVALNPFTDEEITTLNEVIFAPYVPDSETYRLHLENAGFINIEFDNVSALWTDWVNSRYQQHKENKEENIELYGNEIFNSRCKLYSKTAQLFNDGNLGGMRITGEKPLD